MSDIYTQLITGNATIESIHKVTFGTVTVHAFSVDIGDNPSCRDGCPIRLGEKLMWEVTMNVDAFEKERRRQKTPHNLFLEPSERNSLMIEKGYSLKEIVEVVIEIEVIKSNRSESMKLSPREKLLYAFDTAGKTLRRVGLKNSNDDKAKSVSARSA